MLIDYLVEKRYINKLILLGTDPVIKECLNIIIVLIVCFNSHLIGPFI